MSDLKVTKMLMSLKDEWWNNSIESIAIQKVMRLTKSESLSNFPTMLESNATLSELELREINAEDSDPQRNWQVVRLTSRFPPTLHSTTLLKSELEMLRIDLPDEETSEAPALVGIERDDKKRKFRKSIVRWRTSKAFLPGVGQKRVKGLLTDIEGSDSAKTDTIIWKFLKRGVPYRKELIRARTLSLEVKPLKLSDPHIQNTQPIKITCPNCRFFITTNVKKVSNMHTKLSAMVLSIFGLCVIPHIFYTYKDTVHTCPLCKIYLGFCPAFGVWSRRKMMRALKRSKSLQKIENKKMVSASSTSAKNLFVESKLRLSDRVQVNVNNIAAIARQIQRGSKANENLIGAAKNFALQELAIENSETNLKKLKLLSTHLNNQLDSLHNSSLQMESVLEQVRSMQR